MKHSNPSVESQIRLFTDDFNLARIPLTEIDVARSLDSQNRRATKLDQDNVERIMLAVDQGVRVPPIVVNDEVGKYVVIDGNHRLDAFRLNDKQDVWAYIVKVDADTFTQMCLYFNVANGKSLAPAEIMEHALTSVALGMQATVAAKLFGIPSETLSKKRRAIEGRAKAVDAGIKGAAKIPDAVAEVINRIEDAHVKVLGKTLTESSASDVRAAANAISAAPSAERDVVAIKQAGWLENVRQEKAKPKSRKATALTQVQARRAVRQLVVGIRENRALLNDRDLVNALSDLWKVVSDDEEQAA